MAAKPVMTTIDLAQARVTREPAAPRPTAGPDMAPSPSPPESTGYTAGRTWITRRMYTPAIPTWPARSSSPRISGTALCVTIQRGVRIGKRSHRAWRACPAMTATRRMRTRESIRSFRPTQPIRSDPVRQRRVNFATVREKTFHLTKYTISPHLTSHLILAKNQNKVMVR
jgi:hypothetical protein